MAADKGHAGTVGRLLEKLADVNCRYGNGKTPLMSAAAQAYVEVVRVLLQHTADVNAQSENGYTALLYALETQLKDRLLAEARWDGLVCPIEGSLKKPGLKDTVQLLLHAAADAHVLGPRDQSALDLMSSSEELMGLLESHGSKSGEGQGDGLQKLLKDFLKCCGLVCNACWWGEPTLIENESLKGMRLEAKIQGVPLADHLCVRCGAVRQQRHLADEVFFDVQKPPVPLELRVFRRSGGISKAALDECRGEDGLYKEPHVHLRSKDGHSMSVTFRTRKWSEDKKEAAAEAYLQKHSLPQFVKKVFDQLLTQQPKERQKLGMLNLWNARCLESSKCTDKKT
eukprot:g3548.t1